MRFGSTAKVLAKCMLKYYKISECGGQHAVQPPPTVPTQIRCSILLRVKISIDTGTGAARSHQSTKLGHHDLHGVSRSGQSGAMTDTLHCLENGAVRLANTSSP